MIIGIIIGIIIGAIMGTTIGITRWREKPPRIKLTTKETSWSQTEMFPTLNICEESLTSGQARPTHTRHITNSSGQQISHEKNCLLGASHPCAFLKTFRKLKLAGPPKLSILQPLMLDVGVGQKLQDLYCAQTIHIAHSGVEKGKVWIHAPVKI